MDFNKLTVSSQQAVAAAQELARRGGNPELYPEHLLLALLDQELPRELVPDAQPNVSRELNAVFDRADSEAQKLGDLFVSTEHLLLALSDTKGAESKTLLSKAGADFKALTESLDAIRGSHRVTTQTALPLRNSPGHV